MPASPPTTRPPPQQDGDDPDQEPLDLRLALPALAAWLVAFVGRYLPPPAVLGTGALAAAAAVGVLAARRRGRALLAAAVLACVAASAAVTGLHTQSRAVGPLPGWASDRSAVALEGVLVDDPRLAAATGPRRTDLVVVRLRVEVLRRGATTLHLRTPVLVLSSDRAWLPLLPSQRVRAEGRLRAAEPGDDVTAVLSDRGHPVVLSPPSRVQRVAGGLRAGLREAVSPLPERERGLLPGLVVGDVSRLDPHVREDFRTVGLTHLTAVSGTNVAIVTGAVLLLTRRLGFGLRVGPALAGLALLGFVVLARPSPSVLRAAVMGVVGLVALTTGGRRAALPALATAVLALVLVDPDLAGAAGFALSVLATGGLLVLAPPWRRWLGRRLPGWLADAIAVPAAAQAACGPVVVAISSQLGALSVPANLLAALAVAPATVAGVLAALLAPVCLPLAQGVAWLGWLPTAWLVWVARWGSGLPGADLPWPDGARGGLLLGALTLGLLLGARHRRVRLTLLAATTGIAVVTSGAALARPAWPPAGWTMVVCDVGQGDAVVLRVAAGVGVVVDAGPEPRLVDACLRRLGIGQVPLVLVTHLHADHVDGLTGVLRGRQVGQVQIGPLEDPEQQYAELVAEAATAGVPVTRPALGEVRQIGAVRWQVLAPSRVYRGTRSDPNNSSLVLRVELGGTTVLLTGDIEPEAQRDLLTRGIDVRAAVLKVPHHGSDHQDPAFLDAVGARLVLTSVGAGNTYGHPSAGTLSRLTAGGAQSFRTDQDGDVALAVRDGRLVVVPRG